MKSYRLQVIGYRLGVNFLLALCSFSFVFAENITTNLENNRLDLGRVSEGVVLSKEFLVINNSAIPVKINAEALSCSCFTVKSPKGKVEVAPRQSQKIVFDFNSAGFAGKVNKFLYVFTTDTVNSVLRIEVTADIVGEKEKFIGRFLSFRSLAVLGAGLIDGINPCAFTVMVFFVSFLSFAQYRKKDIALVSVFFILAVYITYILIGLGFFNTARNLPAFFLFSRFFYFTIGIFAVILGFINLYDFWVYRKTKDSDKIIAKLPYFIKNKIHGLIREKMIKERGQAKNLLALIFAGASCGFLVSVFELLCTGQLYLPTIAYILKIPDLRVKAVFYLIIYNLMFILPLIAIFLLAFFGLTSGQFEKIAKRNLAAVKLSTALLFFALGIFLLTGRG